MTHPLLRELGRRFPYVTRLNTVISPHEMTVDPVFAYDGQLPDVSNVRDLRRLWGVYACERQERAAEAQLRAAAAAEARLAQLRAAEAEEARQAELRAAEAEEARQAQLRAAESQEAWRLAAAKAREAAEARSQAEAAEEPPAVGTLVVGVVLGVLAVAAALAVGVMLGRRGRA